MVTADKKRVAKNTLMLYIRMIFYMVVSLYTSRVVLQTLGVEDFGIYNVVGGVISMLGFLNASLTGSTARFITFALGKGNFENLKNTFAATSNLHLALAIIIVILGETVGLWFLNTQLTIPAERMEAANWIYQASIVTSFLSIAQMPYSFTIVAHEKMNVYAYVGILEVCLKLGIVYLLLVSPFDKLISYSFLLTGVGALITFIYIFYCRRNYKECRHKLFWDGKLYKELLSFSGWTLYSTISWMTKGQGINMLLNIFFGPVVNAARGIAFQVNSAVKSFISNFSTAFNPQITKLYASEQYNELYPFISQCTKLSSLLLLFLALPILMETDFVLSLWLGEVPEHAVLFTKLVLIESLIDVMSTAMTYGISATGQIKKYQIANGTINLLNLPISYLLLKLGYNANSVFILSICITFAIFLTVMHYANKTYNFPIKQFLKNVVVRVGVIGITSSFILFFLVHAMEPSWERFLLTGFTSVALNLVLSYYIGLNNHERNYIIQVIRKKIHI